MRRSYDGYRSRTHPSAPLHPQPHGYLHGRVTRRSNDIFGEQRRVLTRLAQALERRWKR